MQCQHDCDDRLAGTKSASEPSEFPTKDQNVEAVVPKHVDTGRPKVETTKAEPEKAKDKREPAIATGDSSAVDIPVSTTAAPPQGK